jgi:L-lactate dehydrogenase complex protein LldE
MLTMIKHMINVFVHSDYVVTPSGSYSSMSKAYPKIFANDEAWKIRAEKLANKTYELTQFIVEVLKVENIVARLHTKATYHTSCHMTRLLGVKVPPMKLLNNVVGLQLTE